MPMKTIAPAVLERWLESGEAVLVDVRELAEYAAMKIEGSVSAPYGILSAAASVIARDKKVVIYCRAGARGVRACDKLLKEDPSLEIYHLEGGLRAWREAGYPVVSSGDFILPPERQVQLILGFTLLVGSVAGYFISPLLFLLTGFIGAGLSLAGMTGFCGMAIALTKAPWNRRSGGRAQGGAAVNTH